MYESSRSSEVKPFRKPCRSCGVHSSADWGRLINAYLYSGVTDVEYCLKGVIKIDI